MADILPRPLERRPCGTAELTLPILGVGCWAYGGGTYWGAQNQSDVDEVVHTAFDQGCNLFDTAEAYNEGTSEISLGRALRGLRRDRVIVCTKVSPGNVGTGTLETHCDASLRRLQTDYVDLYLVHWPISPIAIRHLSPGATHVPTVVEAFAGLQKLQRAGKIRHIGVSNFGPDKLAEAMATGARIAVNELPYSLLTRAIESRALPYCRQHGIGVLGYMALMQGVISDRYQTLDDLPEVRRRTRHFDSRKSAQARHGGNGYEVETMGALPAIRAIARRYGMTTSEVALKWALAGPGLTSVLCGARNAAALRQNLAAAREPLSPEIVAELNRATQPLADVMGSSFDYYENPADDRT